MDVQTENMDPPPNDSQPTGKIRKGFKLFGKRKPGNIFSIRSKGDGNNKSSVVRSKTSEGLSETCAQDPEQENGKEVKLEDGEQQEDETLGEDGVPATARTSISSASSAKSLGFLSLLRGGRRAAGDRRAQTVSQPAARQRRGLKGLFSNVKLRSRDKEDKEEAPPSPLLQSSRTNSVEIIKDDMTLTPKRQPRTLDSPEPQRSQPVQGGSAVTPSKGPASAESVSPAHVSPLLTPEPPLVPGDNSLSSLLADISSLLTFDSISGGGDIMADVEAEWGKVSSALSARVPQPSPLSSSCTVKPSPVAVCSPSSTSHPASMKAKPTAAPSVEPSDVPSTSAPSSTSRTVQSISTTAPPPAYASPTVGKLSSFSPTSTPTAKIRAAADPVAEASGPPPSVPQPPTSSSFNPEKSTYFKPTRSSAVGESRDALASSAPAVGPISSPHVAPTISSKITSFTTSPVPSRPTLTPTHLDLNKTVSDPGPPPTFSCTSAPSPAPLDKIPPSTVTSVASGTMPAAQLTETSALPAVAPTSSLTPSAVDQMKVSPAIKPTPASKERPAPTPLDVCQSKVYPAPLKVPPTVSEDQSVPVKSQEPSPKCSTSPAQIPLPVSEDLSADPKLQESKVLPAEIPVSVPRTPPASAQTTFPGSKTPVTSSVETPHPESLPVSPPEPPEPKPTSSPAPPVSWQIDAPSSAKVRVSAQASPDSPDGQVSQGVPSKAKEQPPAKERKTSQSKAPGVSKIPVVGGGRASRQSVRETHDEPSKDLASPAAEEKGHFNSHGAAGRDKISSPEANVPNSKHPLGEHQPPQQAKGVTSSARDSKIPLKHDTQFHAASQVPPTKEPPRTKIPVSKVPVRRAANKAASAGVQIRK